MSNCQSLNKNLENSFHIELMDSLLYFYECKIHGKHRTYFYVLCASGEQSNEKIRASGLQFIYFLACTLF